MGAIAWEALAVVMLAIWIIVNLSTYLMPTWLWIILTPAVTSSGALVVILVAEGYHWVRRWILWADAYLHWWKYSREVKKRLRRNINDF